MQRIRSVVQIGWLGLLLLIGTLAVADERPASLARSALDQCMEEQELVRIARVIDPAGEVVYARVVEDRDGFPSRVQWLAPASTPLAHVFEQAMTTEHTSGAVFELRKEQLCSPVDLPQRELDAESKVIIAVGLNFAAHAEEAGGGEVFLFPKPSAPTSAIDTVHPPAGVTLLDYEVELGFVALDDFDLAALPTRDVFLRHIAAFVTNDISDREPIILEKAVSGPGTGFVTGKGQPTFLPAGPWMVRGDELERGREACHANGLGLRLWVDEGEGPVLRQSSDTSAMIVEPLSILEKLGALIAEQGLRTKMPVSFRGNQERLYPLAVGAEKPTLNAGSLVLTGTPEGVAIGTPSPGGLVLRGMLRLQGPFAQFADEEKEAVASGERGRYLKPRDRVIATIDGLGRQDFTIAPSGTASSSNACRRASD